MATNSGQGNQNKQRFGVFFMSEVISQCHAKVVIEGKALVRLKNFLKRDGMILLNWIIICTGEHDGRQSNTVKFLLYELSLPSFGLLFLLSELCSFVCSECATPSDFVKVLFLCNNKLFLEKCNAIKLSPSKRTTCSQLYSTPFPQKISCSFFNLLTLFI